MTKKVSTGTKTVQRRVPQLSQSEGLKGFVCQKDEKGNDVSALCLGRLDNLDAMIAFVVSLAFFCYLTVIGYAILAPLNRTDLPIRTALLSPAIGIAATVLPVFVINRFGLPVKDFAFSLLGVTLSFAFLLFFLFRPISSFPWRTYFVFAMVFLAAAVLTGRPMFDFGFDWLGFGNDDMANYSLAAQRFFNYGFFDGPNIDELFAGKDYSQLYWFMHVAGKARPGSELLLAYVWGFTGLNPHQSFMSVILALHLSLISVTAGLVYRMREDKKVAFWTSILMATSAMTSLGTLHQLIAQVGGLALMIAAARHLFAIDESMPGYQSLRTTIIVTLLGSALAIYYPEIVPFLVMGLVAHLIFGYVRGRTPSRTWIVLIVASAALSVVLLNIYIIDMIVFLLNQTAGGTAGVDVTLSLFPYFLIPSGLANLWGFAAIAWPLQEPWLSLSILAGIGMIAFTILASTKCLKRDQPPYTAILCVMALLSIWLFVNDADFGLFKLAMFAQPFLLATIAAYAVHQLDKKFSIALLILLIGPSLMSQGRYRELVPENEKSGRNDIPYDMAQFANEISKLPTDVAVLSDTQVIVVEKMQSLYARGNVVFFPSRVYWHYYVNPRTIPANTVSPRLSLGYVSSADAAKIRKSKDLIHAEFDTRLGHSARFNQVIVESPKTYWIVTKQSRDILNLQNGQVASAKKGSFVSVDSNQLRNHLTFVHSSLGHHYYLGNLEKIGLFKPERDVIFPSRIMRGLGSFLLFRADGVEKHPVLRFELTASLIHDGESKLPKAELVGDERWDLGLIGRGSARIFSKPVSFQLIGDARYLAIDMNQPGKIIPVLPKRGFMTLYGTDVPLDNRRMTAFGRDLTLLAPSNRQIDQVPSAIDKFPENLANRALEYSGLYEDGWASEEAFVVLRRRSEASNLRIAGQLPGWLLAGEGLTLTVTVDGKKIAEHTLTPGDFDVTLPLGSTGLLARVDLLFNRYGRTPAPDSRPVTVFLKFLGFV